jgi:hypothetical protein
MFKCLIPLKPVLGGVDDSLQFTVPSMNMLNQVEPATFSILLFFTFFRDSYVLYFITVQRYRVQPTLMLHNKILSSDELGTQSACTMLLITHALSHVYVIS